jgi:hypothetical protein
MSPVLASDATGLLVSVVAHEAAAPLGKLTNPDSYHAALYLKPDDPCSCSGTWPVTLGAQKIGDRLVGVVNYPGDAYQNSAFRQPVQPPAGMSDCEFIRALIEAAARYTALVPYSFPSLPGGAMGPNEFNSNSYVSGLLKAVGARPPALRTLGLFQLPGYQNPLPVPRRP